MDSSKVPTTVDHVRQRALKLVTSAVLPNAVAALARLNVFEALAAAGDAQLTAEEITERALPGKAVNVSYVARLLRMLAGEKILREVVTTAGDGAVKRHYAMEPIARYLMEDLENGSFVHFLHMFHHPGTPFLRPWEHVHEFVLDDSVKPFVRAHGVEVWEFMKQDPQFNKVFNKAMAGHSKVYMRAILDAYHGFEDVKVLVDVGGGFASSLSLITTKYPHIKGINFDQPYVIDACPELPGIKHVSGDMFESIPLGGDAIFMKSVLHNWNDESCLKILKNCHQALPANGKVIVVDYMLPEVINFEGNDCSSFSTDICMLALSNSGGGEKTEQEFMKMGMAAGFKHMKVICKVDSFAITEFYKA